MTLSKCVTNSFSGALRTLAGSFTTSVFGWICSRMCVVVMYDMSNGGSWRSSTTSSVERFERLGSAQCEVVTLLAPELHRLGARRHFAVAEAEFGRRVVPHGVAAPLGLEPQHEGRIAIDVDGRHMVHLDGDVELHG